jgi:hypothetical protein
MRIIVLVVVWLLVAVQTLAALYATLGAFGVAGSASADAFRADDPLWGVGALLLVPAPVLAAAAMAWSLERRGLPGVLRWTASAAAAFLVGFAVIIVASVVRVG